MTNNAPVVSVAGLHVRRGRAAVLHGLQLSVPRGQVVGLLGPSGCGKTTLMRSIVGVQRVDSGTVTVLGEPAGSAVLRHKVGYVAQTASVYDDLTVRQNVDYFRRVLGAPAGDVQRVLEATALTGQHARLVGGLSGGQRSRVSLAAAMLGSPELLVLDEPTVGLDPVLRVELWGLFHRLAASGAGIVVSSHVMDEATRCDRLLLMREGEILFDDSPAALLTTTGAPDAENAFLAVISARGGPSGPGPAAGQHGQQEQHGRQEQRGRHGPGRHGQHEDGPGQHAQAAGRRGRAPVNARRTWATTGRVLTQVRHDPRTIALLLLVPTLLIGLVAWIFSDTPAFSAIGPAMIALFPFIVMFLVTSIATLRERRTGTLERLLALPLGRGDFLLGYTLAFGLLAVVQASIAVAYAVWVCGLGVDGPIGLLLLVAVMDAVLGTTLGLLASAFARTEFQVVQFMPVLVFPQILLGGIFLQREQLPDVLRAIGDWLPLSHAIDALNAVAAGSDDTASIWLNIAAIAAYSVGAVVLGSLTLRRRTP